MIGTALTAGDATIAHRLGALSDNGGVVPTVEKPGTMRAMAHAGTSATAARTSRARRDA